MQPRRLVTPVVIGAAVVTVAALAASAHGYPVQHVSMNDGAIWITDNNAAGGGSGAAVARFAKPIEQLDGQLTPKSATRVDVWQNGPLVAVYASAPAGGRMYAVNVDQPNFADPAGSAVSPVSPDTSGIAVSVDPDAAGATVAVLGGGSLRSAVLGPAGGLGSLSLSAPALAKHLAPGSVVAVGTDNSIWVAGGGELRQFPPGATTPAVTNLPPVFQAGDSLQVTTVGNVPVVADLTAKELYLPDGGKTVPLPSTAGFELQQASPASGVAVMATSTSLYAVILSSGQLYPLSTGESGTPAAPVQVGGCVQAAWAQNENGHYLRTCGTPPPSAVSPAVPFSTGDPNPQLVFRVNNGAVVLNDTADGGVFVTDATIKNATPKWQQSSTGAQSNVPAQGGQLSQQFQATPLTQGVRPGVTTEVHVLDAVKGDPAQTYAVTAVGTPDQPGVTVSVSPDAQTVLATVTTLSATAHFQYTVSDEHGHSATSQVTLVPHPASENSAPFLKLSYQQPPLKVTSGGTLVIPVIGDWRDADGDPLYIDSGSVSPSIGSAAVTSGGALSFTAPRTATEETATLSYGVSDGRVAKPTPATLRITVFGSSAKELLPPVAEPDAAQAMAGTPITLHPLANDLPGVDWTNPQATLRLAAPLAQVAGATVATDVADGTVTFTARQAADYVLSYTDAYGAAPTAKGTIRVHVIPASGKPQPPVTTPDVAVLHGQQPALVDVLADDSDPQGWLLGITDATSDTPGVHVAVIDQEWLRISADNPVPGLTATVSYTVSDGKGKSQGTVAVSAVAANPAADQITTTLSTVTVRAGDSAAVPVLAGDASSTDLPLSLAGTPPTSSPPVGLIASAQGTDIRVDAPASVKTEEETAVSYVATDADGTTAAGELDVTIMPAPLTPAQDQAPVPQELDTREAAGDTAIIQIPVSGVDPDGDSVTVTRVTVPPTLGRIVAVTPDTISYQSYPGSAGTDSFTYEVTDPYGRTGTAEVRIAVLPGGQPQPPIAVDDVISAPPGMPLHWDVLGNDYIAPGDKVTVEPLKKTNPAQPAGVQLTGSVVSLQVPAAPSDPPVQFTYGATDGGIASLAQVSVHAVKGAQIPPIANDVVAPAPAQGASTVTVNVLKHAGDPVGSSADLAIHWAGAGATVAGANLVIKLTAHPREVPYQVITQKGLTATAVVYVPGTQSSVISLKPGARINVKENGTVTEPLSSVLTDSAGRQLKITTTTALTASPSTGLSVNATQQSAFTLHALGGYAGPGAVTVQVYDGQQIQDGTVATLTIPVQVGSDAPVLHCPGAPLQVVEGGAPVSYDIGQLCHVSLDSTSAQPPHYTASWSGQPVGGVSVSVPGGTALALSAASSATPGAPGTLKITPTGATAGGTLSIEVVKAPLPVGRAASVSTKGGQAVTVDLNQYVTSPLAKPVISVLDVTPQAGSTATAAVVRSGSRIIVTPGADAKGTLTLAVAVSDQPDRTDREILVAVTVTVINVPSAPGTPTATTSSHTIVASFGAAAPNGAPVEFYTVYTNGAPHQCPASPCTVTGLNNSPYTVYVTATNSAGTSLDSGQITAQPNAVPDQVTGLVPTPGDGTVTLSWQPAQVDGTPVTDYEVEVSPLPAGLQQPTSAGVATSYPFTGLTNGTTYTFTVLAVNAAGNSPQSLGVTAVPFGKPTVTGAPTATSAAVPDPSATLGITVSLASLTVNSNGSAVTSYKVDEYKAGSGTGPFGGGTPFATETLTGTGDATFTVNNDGSYYEYGVIATNKAGNSTESALSGPAIRAVAPPDAPTGVTATATGAANTIQFSFTPGAANGASVSSIEYGINGGTLSGTFPGPFTAGQSTSKTLTSADNPAIADGTPVTIYVAECNEAGLCSSFSGPSAQVTPYGPIGTPTVTATANGTTINYTWNAPSDGLAETLQLCIAGVCNNEAVPATGGLSGTPSGTYGNSQTETITAHLTDTANQSSATASASATTAPPPPANATVSVQVGNVEAGSTKAGGACAGNAGCVDFLVTPANFTPGATLTYSCIQGGTWWTASQSWSGATVTANNAFYTQCLHKKDNSTVTIQVTDGTHTASGGVQVS